MKRFLSLFAVLVLLVSLAAPVYASEFVPSITDKNAPELVPSGTENGKPVVGHAVDENGVVVDPITEDCIIITPVSQAEQSDEIPEDAKDLLLELYEGLVNGSITLPFDKYFEDVDPDEMVIRDLLDISLLCGDHPAVVGQAGVSLTVTLNLGVSADTELYIMSYVNGEWVPAKDVVNNGDGTVTLSVEDVGPLAIAVRGGTDSAPSKTGDPADITLWVVLMTASLVALVAVVCLRRKMV